MLRLRSLSAGSGAAPLSSQAVLLVFLLVCLVFFALVAPGAALALAGALLGYALAVGWRGGAPREGLNNPPPGAGPPDAVAMPRAPAAARAAGVAAEAELPRPCGASALYGRTYPGAIETDGLDGEAGRGIRDLTEDDRDLPEGNPFALGREAAPAAAGPCVDDEANNEEYDGDEQAALQQTIRNEPTRVTAGTMRRRTDLDRYLREEVEEEEDRRWFGRHER